MNLRKVSRNVLALTLAAAGLVMAGESEACDKCTGSRTQQCSCKQNDGLLHALDGVVSGLHRSLGTASKNSGCDHGPSCGCEPQTGPGCGVEMRQSEPSCGVEPTCGAEQYTPSCGCETSGGCNCSSGGTYSAPSQAPNYAPPLYDSPSYGAPMQSVPPQPQATPRVRVPAPLPDSQVDPFQDEAVHYNPGRTRAMPIQYRRAAGSYGVRFNDSAMQRYHIPNRDVAVRTASSVGTTQQPTSRTISGQAGTLAGRRVVQRPTETGGTIHLQPAGPARLQDGGHVKPLPASGAPVRSISGGNNRYSPVTRASAVRPVNQPAASSHPSTAASYYNPLRQ